MAARLATGLALAAALVFSPARAAGTTVSLVVPVPGEDHPVWRGASRLESAARARGVMLEPRRVEPEAAAPTLEGALALAVLPVHTLTRAVPALALLELAFAFRDLDALHRALDGALGEVLRREARGAGWEVLAFWDEGMQHLSGNRAYNHVFNLGGMEFLLLRPDPVAERHFLAFDAWTRRAAPASLQALHTECLVASREATLHELWGDRIDRVHLDLTLTGHRYAGWLVAAPADGWARLPETERGALVAALREVLADQRAVARKAEATALEGLVRGGMSVYRLDAEGRASFLARLPPMADRLPAGLAPETRAELLRAAGASLPPAPQPQQGAVGAE